MRLLLQRVAEARVRVDGQVLGEIGSGLLVLAGFGSVDGPDLPESQVWRKLLSKVVDLRIFPDAEGRLNLSLADCGGGLLVVPQFTLYADCRKGRRPSFSFAAPSAVAQALYKRLVLDLAALLPGRVEQGVFGAHMRVELANDGPVTIWLDSADLS